MSLKVLLGCEFLRLSLFLITLTVLRHSGQVFCRISFRLNCLTVRQGLPSFGKKDTEVTWHIMSRVLTETWLHCWRHFDHPMEAVFVRFSSVNLPFSLPFHIGFWGRKSPLTFTLEEHRICCCSVAKSCLTLCNPMGCSTPGFPVLHHLPEFAQVHVHIIQTFSPQFLPQTEREVSTVWEICLFSSFNFIQLCIYISI